MRTQKVLAREFQFYFSDLDNIILVETGEDENVTIRSSKNNVSYKRKISFIRELAAEGFIPDHYEWFSGSLDGSDGLRWIHDYSWLTRQPTRFPKSNRFMKCLLVFSSVLWIAMMRVLLVSGQPRDFSETETRSAETFDLSNIHGRRVNPPLISSQLIADEVARQASSRSPAPLPLKPTTESSPP